MANKARKALKRLTKKTNAFPPLRDERLVKGPVSSYMRFNNERMNSGDYKLMKLRERSVLIAKEWRELGASEKKVSFPQAVKVDLDNILTRVHFAEIRRRLRTR